MLLLVVLLVVDGVEVGVGVVVVVEVLELQEAFCWNLTSSWIISSPSGIVGVGSGTGTRAEDVQTPKTSTNPEAH